MRLLILASMVVSLSSCAEDVEEAEPEAQPVEIPEEPVEELAAEGPAGFTQIAHCGRFNPAPSIGESRMMEVSVRDLRTESRVDMQIESGVVGWLCVFDRFRPGEERTPRGSEHVHALGLVWSAPRSLGSEEAPTNTLPDNMFVLTEASVEAVQAFERRILDAADDDEQATACAEAMAYRIEPSEADRDGRVDPILAGDNFITWNRPMRAARSVEFIRRRCSPTE